MFCSKNLDTRLLTNRTSLIEKDMTKLEKVEIMYETLKEELGAEILLEDLYQALNTDELEENFEYIARMRAIEFEF